MVTTGLGASGTLAPRGPADRSALTHGPGSPGCSPTGCCGGAVRCGGRNSASSRSATGSTAWGATRSPSTPASRSTTVSTSSGCRTRIGLNFEKSVNQWVAAREWIAQVLDYYYATLHFVVTIGVLVWLFVKRPHVYRGARTVLFTTTLIALAGFALYPTAPPRLLPGMGYIDTVIKFHTWGSLAQPEIAAHSNQYAAMPSLHIGWALWAGLSLFMCARSRWWRAFGLLYPFFTLLVIVATANHYIIDAVGGALVVALAFGVQWLLSGHGAYTPPFDAPGLRHAGPAAAVRPSLPPGGQPALSCACTQPQVVPVRFATLAVDLRRAFRKSSSDQLEARLHIPPL